MRAQAETARELTRSEGLRLGANSSLQVDNDPTLALLLGVEAAKRHPGVDANDAIMEALDMGHEARVLNGHATAVGHVSFNHDGTRLVSSATTEMFGQVKEDGGKQIEIIEPAIVWDTNTGEVLGKLQSTKAITSAAFSPDKYRILTASSPPENKATNDIDETLPAAQPSLWDGTTFKELATFEGAYLFKAHPGAFGPEGSTIVLPTTGNQAAIFECVAGNRIKKLEGHQGRVVFAAFNPDGDRIVTASDDNTVRIWDVESVKEILKLDGWVKPGVEKQTRDLTWVEFSPDGRRLVSGSTSVGIQLWDMEKELGKEISDREVSREFGDVLWKR